MHICEHHRNERKSWSFHFILWGNDNMYIYILWWLTWKRGWILSGMLIPSLLMKTSIWISSSLLYDLLTKSINIHRLSKSKFFQRSALLCKIELFQLKYTALDEVWQVLWSMNMYSYLLPKDWTVNQRRPCLHQTNVWHILPNVQALVNTALFGIFKKGSFNRKK